MEKRYITNNDIEIFHYPNLNTHSFCLSLYIRAGALFEQDEENGITHFLEHMLFRNINHLMGGEMYRQLDKMGLYFNGATYKEFIQLFIIGAPEHFMDAAKILMLAFEPMTLPANDIKTEQQRVKAEIRESEDFKSLDYFAGTHVWKDTSLRNTILGTKGNVNSFNRKKTAAYHEEVFSSENLFFYVTGCVDESMIKAFARAAEDLPVKLSGKKRENLAPVPANFGNRDAQIEVKNSTYTMVQFSFDLEVAKYSGPELALLYDILFSGENSLMHQELSEKRGMIYSSHSVLEKYNNIGRICWTYEVAARDLYDSVEIVLKGLTEMTEDMDERLSLVMPEYVDNAYLIYDDNEGFNWQRAYEQHIMDGTSMSIEETKASYKAVSAERLCEISREIFRLENLVMSLKADKKKTDVSRLKAIVRNTLLV